MHTTETLNFPDHILFKLIIEDNPKFLCLKSDLQKDFAAAGYLFEAPSPSRFLSWGG